jgi:hypothetical protein
MLVALGALHCWETRPDDFNEFMRLHNQPLTAGEEAPGGSLVELLDDKIGRVSVVGQLMERKQKLRGIARGLELSLSRHPADSIGSFSTLFDCAPLIWDQAIARYFNFWDIIFEKAQRPILWEVFRQLDDRMTRYNPLLLKLFPDPTTRPRQREVLIEFYRKGEVDEALRAFKKIYLEVVHQMIDHLETAESANSPH